MPGAADEGNDAAGMDVAVVRAPPDVVPTVDPDAAHPRNGLLPAIREWGVGWGYDGCGGWYVWGGGEGGWGEERDVRAEDGRRRRVGRRGGAVGPRRLGICPEGTMF